VSDPHIDKVDAKQLIKETAASIGKISEDKSVVISTTPYNRKYERLLLPFFDNVIRVTNDIKDGKVLQADVRNQNHRIGGKGSRFVISTQLRRRELSLVPSK
jgi:hypothetical protein